MPGIGLTRQTLQIPKSPFRIPVDPQYPYGMCVFEVIPEPLKTLYRSAYLNVFATRRQWVHEYECSSATAHRLFRMTALHRPKDEFILVTNFILGERPHGDERLVMQSNPAVYEGHGDSIATCSLCRRARRRDLPGMGLDSSLRRAPPSPRRA